MTRKSALYGRLAGFTRSLDESLVAGDLEKFSELLDARQAAIDQIDAQAGDLTEEERLEVLGVLNEMSEAGERHLRSLEELRPRLLSEIQGVQAQKNRAAGYRNAAVGGLSRIPLLDRKD